jgi:hypothetical protein
VSIKVKVGGGRSIKAVPKQGSTTSIVAPAQTKPQIVPDSVVLGIDTIGNYVQQITSANGIIVTQTTYDQASNVVIGHADTSNAVSTTNPNLSYPKNISIDTFGHVTDFENVSFNPLNFFANSTVISSADITIGTTALTLGETTSELNGLTNLTISGLFTGNDAAFLNGIDVTGQAEVGSLNVEDLTSGRIVYAGANGELIDSAGMTFDGTSIIATGGVFLDNMSVPGQASLGSVNIIDLTQGRIMYAGANGELIDSANLSFDGVSITATGGVFLDILSVPGQTTLGSVNVTDLTSGRITYAGASGELIDSSKLTFNGSLFTVDGDVDVTGNVTIGGNLTLGDNQTDTINVVADFTSDLIPDESDSYSLGTPTKEWRRIFTPTLKSSSGVVTIDETGALVLPVGGTADRPANNQVGMVRYNDSDNRFEGYDGTAWAELAGSVKDVNKDTFIRAETAPGDNNDDLDFFTNGTQRLQLDEVGAFKYGADLNKFTIDYATGDTDIAGQTTLATLAISDIPAGSVVFTGANGQTRGEANLAWDGSSLTIVGGITVDGDFATSGGLSGDSLSVGNLSANTMMFVSDTGALSSNNNIQFDGSHLVVNATSQFLSAPTFETVSQGQVFIAGANGAIQGDDGLTYNSTTNVLSLGNLTQNGVVFAGASGALTDSTSFTWDGSLFRVDGGAEFTGNVVIGGNLQLGDNNTLDSINVVADFTSDLLPQADATYNIGAAGSNWDTVYTNKLVSDTGIVTIDTLGAIKLPAGATADRPTPLSAGLVRFNTSDGVFEGYIGTAWASLGGVKDVDQDTYIDAESSPGADNDELRFFTGGTLAFKVDSNQAIKTDGSTNLVFDIGGHIDVSNTVITGLAEPIANTDAVTKYYVENTFNRELSVTKGANTYSLDLFSGNPKIDFGTALTIESYDAANNFVQIGLDPVWQSFEGLREAGVEGTVPNFEFDVYGRVRSLINIPLSVSSNAVVDFVPSIYQVVEDAVRNGNIEQGITVTADAENQKLDFSVHNFDINLTGAVTGSSTVVHNSNTTVDTTFDYVTLDQRYMNVQDGDTANGNIGAWKFVDSANTDFYTYPSNTSRLNGLIVGFGQAESQIQMATGGGQYQYIYADETKIGFLGASFNFGTYFDTTNSSWNVNDGSVYSRNFIDSQNVSYLLNPAGQNSRFGGLKLDTQLQIGGNGLKIANNTISNSVGNIVISSTGSLNVDNNIITGLSNPVNSNDAVNKIYLETELATIALAGISIQAENATDVVQLGETITFTAGEGIITEVANNELTIAAELATDSNIGVASFNLGNFTVTAGDVAVTTLDGGTF